MSNFECSVKDLMSHTEPIDENTVTSEDFNPLIGNVELNKTKDVDSPPSIEKPPDINLSMYQRLYTDKNIKTLLFITLVYLALNSEQMYTFLSNTAPLLLIEGSPGFLGKAAIGLILGMVIILFTSFFSF
tara:strand:- start:5334 stop:5723 length:390 start_codon:yes stop_codon:yes gene_type:complete